MHSRTKLVLPLSRYPGFCCCCICLKGRDARRMQRILKIVRRTTRDW